MKQCYKDMAKIIKTNASLIAPCISAKQFEVFNCLYGSVYVESDAGFESIIIGDISGNHGYMYLYHCDTERRNSFPSVTKIAKLLEAVANQEDLEEGDGKSEYHCNDKKYLANLVRGIAGDM
jgi:hypothetical protein